MNKDLESLVSWGEDNRTEFEPTKTKMMVISRKRVPFDPTGIVMLGFPIEVVDEVKLVGYTIDPKLTWGPMITALAKKARLRVGALFRMSSMLDAENMKTMYIAFIRSVLEFGSVQYMGAAQSHLDKLDRIQHTAERIGGFVMSESLSSRRESALLGLSLKLLDGAGRGALQEFAPILEVSSPDPNARQLRKVKHGIRVQDRTSISSLECFKRSAVGALPSIWDNIPQELLQIGSSKGWRKIHKRCKKAILTAA